MAAPEFPEGRITHASIGRLNVEAGDKSVTLRLWQHSLQPYAVLTLSEAQTLVERLGKAIAVASGKKARRTSVSDVTDDYSDIA